MRIGKIAIVTLVGSLAVGVILAVVQPWDGPTRVGAVELDDEAVRRQDEGEDGTVRGGRGEGDDDGSGTRGGGARDARSRGGDDTDDGGARGGRSTRGGAVNTDDGGGAISAVGGDSDDGDDSGGDT